jgi:phytoene dehydrogenase-like protein
VSFDHVIIGGGINGLVAAAMLAGGGQKVLLLERADHVGGCMLSGEVTLPGFTHDVMAATFVLFLTGPAYAALGPDLARHGLELSHTTHPTAVVRPDGSSAVLSTDRAANIAAFNELSPGDGDRHSADVGSVEANAPLLFGLLGGQLWSLSTARLIAREAWRRGPRGLAEYFGAALAPARGWLESTYGSPEIRALHAPWTLHCGLSPEDTYSAQMGKVVAFALEAAGAPIVKGERARRLRRSGH